LPIRAFPRLEMGGRGRRSHAQVAEGLKRLATAPFSFQLKLRHAARTGRRRQPGRLLCGVLGHCGPMATRSLDLETREGRAERRARLQATGYRLPVRHTVGRWGRLTTRCAAGECLQPRTRPTAWFFSGPRARRTSAPPHSFPCPWAAPQLFLSLGCCCCICCCICCCRRLCCICRMGRTCRTRRICCASVSQARRISAPPRSFPCPSSR